MKRYVYLFLLVVALALFAGCTSTGTTEDTSDDSTVETGIETVVISSGGYLTDSEGMTLYIFTKDANGESACSGACLNNWPVYYSVDTKPGSGLDSSDFGVITRGDEEKQTIYKGQPLYYFAKDTVPGDTKGDGVNDVWFVVEP